MQSSYWEILEYLVIGGAYMFINFFELLNQGANISFLITYKSQLPYVLILFACVFGHILKLICCYEGILIIALKKRCCSWIDIAKLSWITFVTALIAMVSYNVYLIVLMCSTAPGKNGRTERITLVIIMILMLIEFLCFLPIHFRLLKEKKNEQLRQYVYVQLPSRFAYVLPQQSTLYFILLGQFP